MGILKRIYNKLRFNPLNMAKTLYINFRFLPLGDALHLPILIYGKTSFNFFPGCRLSVKGKNRRGMIKIGLTDPFRSLDSKTYIELRGKLEISEDTFIRRGLRMVVFEKGEVFLGKNCFISDNVTLSCFSRVSIDDDTTIGNNCMIMDSDFHFVKNKASNSVSANFKPITIGKNNWIGSWCAVKKGAFTPDHTIVAGPYSMINKDYTGTIKPGSVIGGSPAKLLKENVEFIKDKATEKYLYTHFLRSSEDVSL